MTNSSVCNEFVHMSISGQFDYTKQQHSDHSNSAMMSFKRKCSYDEVALSEQIKRFRITNTPGELRLQKDIKELKACGLNGISLQQSDDSGSIIVQFTEMIPFAPALFRISVPRYYPHNHPIVFCITEGFPCPFISPTGEITHPRLREDWSAVGTLLTVIETLQSIRLMRHNTFCADHSSSGHSILEEIHDAPKEAYAINMAEGILPGEES